MRLLTDLQKAEMLGAPLRHGIQWVGAKNKDLCLSWSKIEKFEQCPRLFKEMYIDKSLPFDGNNPVLVWGTKVHKAMEEHMLQNKRLTVEFKQFQPIADSIKHRVADLEERNKIKAPLNGEQDWAITAEGKYTTWFDSANVFMRNKADLVYGTTSTLFTFDWKTGQGKRPKPEQLEVVALSAKGQPRLARYDKHVASLIFLEANKVVPLRLDLSGNGHEELMRKYLQKGIDIVDAYEEGEWAMNKTPLCAYCDVYACPYNTKEK